MHCFYWFWLNTLDCLTCVPIVRVVSAMASGIQRADIASVAAHLNRARFCVLTLLLRARLPNVEQAACLAMACGFRCAGRTGYGCGLRQPGAYGRFCAGVRPALDCISGFTELAHSPVDQSGGCCAELHRGIHMRSAAGPAPESRTGRVSRSCCGANTIPAQNRGSRNPDLTYSSGSVVPW